MWERLFESVANQCVQVGTLTITMPDGQVRQYGDGAAPEIGITITDTDTLKAICLNPELGVGEGYMNGKLVIEGDDLDGFLTLAISNVNIGAGPRFQRPVNAVRRFRQWVGQFNRSIKARANVAHHYDLSADLYELFLDADKQYSCAYFEHPDMSLEEAQAAKKAHIGRKLLIEPGMEVLDIGCGWGGMALTLAQDFGAKVTGVTLSEEQLKIAQTRAEAAGLADRVSFRLMDYRAVKERFDRIVSVGMFEHVGQPQFRNYFRTVHDRLREDGVALIHTIGSSTPPGMTSPWIDKYIFPGGYIPSMSETMSAVEKEGLYTCDVEVWRLHYADTLRHWHDRFVAAKKRVVTLYDERFFRMWKYYLVASELTFRLNNQCVFQFQLAHRQEAVPLTRNYLYQTEDQARQMAAE